MLTLLYKNHNTTVIIRTRMCFERNSVFSMSIVRIVETIRCASAASSELFYNCTKLLNQDYKFNFSKLSESY